MKDENCGKWEQIFSYQQDSVLFTPSWKNFGLYDVRQIAKVRRLTSNNLNMRTNAHKKFKNELSLARASRGLSRKNVAQVLGYKRTTPLSNFERGKRLPSLKTALRLEILYRRPVAFLFPDLYVSLRSEIREAESQFKQQTTS